MSELATFLRLGVEHITAPGALDHLLFLLALVAPYRLHDWRRVALISTAFTAGHSLTLALVVTGIAAPPAALIELLIPLTIVAAGVENLRSRGTLAGGWGRPLLAGGFGLIHGAGFAGFLQAMLGEPAALPLVGFNFGLELGQLAILTLALLALTLADRVLAGLSAGKGGLALRVRAASAVAAGWALLMAIERVPW